MMLLVIEYLFAAWTSRFLMRNRLKQKLLESSIFFRDNCYVINDILRLNQTTFLIPLYILPQIKEETTILGVRERRGLTKQ